MDSMVREASREEKSMDCYAGHSSLEATLELEHFRNGVTFDISGESFISSVQLLGRL